LGGQAIAGYPILNPQRNMSKNVVTSLHHVLLTGTPQCCSGGRKGLSTRMVKQSPSPMLSLSEDHSLHRGAGPGVTSIRVFRSTFHLNPGYLTINASLRRPTGTQIATRLHPPRWKNVALRFAAKVLDMAGLSRSPRALRTSAA